MDHARASRGGRFAVAVGMVAAVALLAPTAAVAGPLDPQLRTEANYFHCSAPTKLGNANLVAANAIPSWNTTAPTASVATGAGCGTEDVNGVAFVISPQENPTDGVWKGTFTGNLDTLTVEVHCFLCIGTARADGLGSLGVRLNIDGTARTGDGSADHAVTAVDANSGATQIYRFSVTNIGLIEPNIDADGDGIGDNPFGKEAHTLTLTIDGYFVEENALGMWVYDASEVKSGITFNPTTLAATQIMADPL